MTTFDGVPSLSVAVRRVFPKPGRSGPRGTKMCSPLRKPTVKAKRH